jgi:hypothetical protein
MAAVMVLIGLIVLAVGVLLLCSSGGPRQLVSRTVNELKPRWRRSSTGRST